MEAYRTFGVGLILVFCCRDAIRSVLKFARLNLMGGHFVLV